MLNGDDLARKLLRAEDHTQLLKAQQDGMLPMALGVGLCGAMTWEFLRRKDCASPLHRGMLISVAVLNIITLIIMAIDQRIILSTPELGDLFTRDTSYLYSTYLIFSFIAVICQTYFGLRAWRLWRWKWYVALPIFTLSGLSFVLRFIYTVWSYTGPALRSDMQGNELLEVRQWYTRFINARQILQTGSGMAGLRRYISLTSVLITGLIMLRLLRMRSLMSSSSLVDKILLLTMESMLPPMLAALTYIIVRFCPVWAKSCSIGAGTWFRHMGSMQSLIYWFAMVQVLRTQKSFHEKLTADDEITWSDPAIKESAEGMTESVKEPASGEQTLSLRCPALAR